jgi:hypothetical protein
VQQLGTIDFSKDKLHPSRANNEAKAALDGIALQLQQNPDAKLVVVGQASAKEHARTEKEAAFALKHKHAMVVDLAAERAVNVKDYLVTEKGIDASRISVATDNTKDAQAVETYLVPSGANFAVDVTGTTTVDETAVKPHPIKAIKRAVKKVVKKVT